MEDLCKSCNKRPINHERSKRKCTICLDNCSKSVKEYYQKNRDRVLMYEKEYRKIHREKIQIYNKNRYEEKKDEIKQKQAEYRAKNKEKILLSAKLYREKNKEKVRIAKKRCRDNNHDYYRTKEQEWKENNRERRMLLSYISTKKRRAYKYGLTEHYTNKEWEQVLKYWNFRCVNCGSETKIEPDHIVPLSKGGSDTIDNIQPLCLSCNRKKMTKIIDYRWLCT